MKNCERAHRCTRLGLIVSLGLLLVVGCGGGEPKLAANVEGISITSAQVDELYDVFAKTAAGQEDINGAGPDSVKVDPKQIRAAVLSYKIKIAFLDSMATREHVAVPDRVKPDVYQELAGTGSLQAAGYRPEDLEIAARIEAISKAIAAKLLPTVTVTEAELSDAYKERQDLFGKSFRATTDVAFMASPAAAATLKKGLDDGQKFNDLTARLGTDTLVAQTVELTSLSPLSGELLDKVRTLDAGHTAEPIQYELGGVTVFVVLHQQARKDLPALSLKQATPELTQIVTEHKRFLFFQDWLKKQYESARIDVNGYYGKWNPTFQAVV